ncbi:calcium-independent phospholipase [Thozetella sp. PMI_491]|nr:calcium-independent phospholipase [Thozetella sp. PMI_491]
MKSVANSDVSPYLPATKHPNGVRLLSLDGGGVKGLSSLIMLDKIMNMIQLKIKATEPCLPADYFELAAGTSTGGIIALMLFRLRMTTDQAIRTYKDIAKEVFANTLFGYDISGLGLVGSWISKSKPFFHSAQFDEVALERVIDRVVAAHGLDEEDKRLKGDALVARDGAAKMILCTTAQNKTETVLFRSYPHHVTYFSSQVNKTMGQYGSEITIKKATRATSAAPTYFKELEWNGLVFWDGGLLNNNPIDQLWAQRYDLVKPTEAEPKVSCVVSLGCGYVKPTSPSQSRFQLSSLVMSLIGFATNTEAKGKDFSRHIKNLNRRDDYARTKYFRFNTNLCDHSIGLADHNKMELLEKLTHQYLDEEGNKRFLNECVDALLAERKN